MCGFYRTSSPLVPQQNWPSHRPLRLCWRRPKEVFLFTLCLLTQTIKLCVLFFQSVHSIHFLPHRTFTRGEISWGIYSFIISNSCILNLVFYLGPNPNLSNVKLKCFLNLWIHKLCRRRKGWENCKSVPKTGFTYPHNGVKYFKFTFRSSSKNTSSIFLAANTAVVKQPRMHAHTSIYGTSWNTFTHVKDVGTILNELAHTQAVQLLILVDRYLVMRSKGQN